jgi:hydrogenase expression/formation protein HypC
MCIAVPREVLQVRPGEALLADAGETWVSLALLSDEVAPGDWVVLQARRYAVARMDAEEARIRLELFAELGLVDLEEASS